jgi:TonB family protein
MNGQFALLTGPVAGTEGGFVSRFRYAALRLFVALIGSCLLHLMVFVLVDHRFFARHGGSGANGAGRPYALSAVLSGAGRAGSIMPDRMGQGEAGQVSSLPAEADSVEVLETVWNGESGANNFFLPPPPYYLTSELTIRPQALSEVELSPSEIFARGSSGRVVLNLWISESGEVVAVYVEISDMPEQVSVATEAAFRNLRFKPGEIDGKAVGSVMKVEAVYGNALPPVR